MCSITVSKAIAATSSSYLNLDGRVQASMLGHGPQKTSTVIELFYSQVQRSCKTLQQSVSFIFLGVAMRSEAWKSQKPQKTTNNYSYTIFLFPAQWSWKMQKISTICASLCFLWVAMRSIRSLEKTKSYVLLGQVWWNKLFWIFPLLPSRLLLLMHLSFTRSEVPNLGETARLPREGLTMDQGRNGMWIE